MKSPTRSEADGLRQEIRRLIKLGRNMLSMIEEYHQCEWEEEPFTPDIEDMEFQLESPICCPLCKGSGATDGALGFNGEGLCPRCASVTSSLYEVRVTAMGSDKLACCAHLRKLSDLIMSGDATSWTTSDANGSTNAEHVQSGRT